MSDVKKREDMAGVREPGRRKRVTRRRGLAKCVVGGSVVEGWK